MSIKRSGYGNVSYPLNNRIHPKYLIYTRLFDKLGQIGNHRVNNVSTRRFFRVIGLPRGIGEML